MAGPVVAHMVCNFMGFPPVHEVAGLRPLATRNAVAGLYLAGLAAWAALLPLLL